MRNISIIFLSVFITSCSSNNNEVNVCNEIKVTNKLIENRISILNKGIFEGAEKHTKSRRLKVIKDVSIAINQNFDFIINNNFNEEKFDSIIKSIEEKFNYIYFDLDRNSENLDLQYKFEFENSVLNLQSLIGTNNDNCIEVSIQRIKIVQEHILSTLLSITKNNKFLFNKIEIVPLPMTENLLIDSGDSCSITVGVFAYDSTRFNQTRYWIDDSLKNPENMISKTTWGRMHFGGKKGKHKVYGELLMIENNVHKWENWYFDYEVK